MYKLISLRCRYLREDIFMIFRSWNEAHFYMNCKAQKIKQMTDDAFNLTFSGI